MTMAAASDQGHEARPADQRRPVAMAVADVVGCSTLMASDEHATSARQMALPSTLIVAETARHGGRIVDIASGGGLAIFPGAVEALGWVLTAPPGVRTGIERPGAGRAGHIMGIHPGEVFEAGPHIFGDAVHAATG